MANLSFTGRIKQIGQLQRFTTSQGTEFVKLELVLETEEEYPQSVCITLKSDRATSFCGTIGQLVNAHLSFRANEHNGRYFTEINCWRIDFC